MRHVAKNLVAAGLARKCEVGIAYAIGVAKPVSIFVDSYGTGVLPDDQLSEIVGKVFDLRPAAIVRDLDLKKPGYARVASYGHFGRDDLDLTWEKLDKVDELKAAAGIQSIFPNSITERFPAWRALRFLCGVRRSSPQKPLLLRIWRGVRPV